MKTLLKILAAIGLIIVLGIVAIFFMTSGLVDTAEDFFAAASSNDTKRAYSYLSEDFRSGTSETELKNYLRKNSLNNVAETSWESRSINGGRGTLSGSIQTKSGGVVPVTLHFVKGADGWKIYSIQKPTAGLSEETTTHSIPSESELVKLTADTTRAFAASVNDKSMSKFYSHISNLWQQQTTVEELDQVFGGYYELGADLSVLNNVSPTFQPKPTITEEGTMLVKGYYPTNPDQFHFEHTYVYEGLGWKIIGLNTQVR